MQRITSGYPWSDVFAILIFMNSPSPLIFDRALVRRHVMRAKAHFAEHSALFDTTAAEIEERLLDIKRDFPNALDLSPFPFLKTKAAHITAKSDLESENEFLSLAPNSFDLITSNLGMHWVNDVPGLLAQIYSSLKSEGFFIAALIGENSLHELRSCLIDAEVSVSGGISPRLSPMISLLDASTLLQRASFQLPVVDMENVTLLYSDMFALMRDLRGMGQSNAHRMRLRHPSRRAMFLEAARLYQERFGDAGGHIPASFDIIYLHGWK